MSAGPVVPDVMVMAVGAELFAVFGSTGGGSTKPSLTLTVCVTDPAAEAVSVTITAAGEPLAIEPSEHAKFAVVVVHAPWLGVNVAIERPEPTKVSDTNTPVPTGG